MSEREHVYTGRVLESELLGETEGAVERNKAEYQSYREAMSEVKAFEQKGTYFVRDLTERLTTIMAVPAETVRFYTALGTTLDYFHGIDGFFELDINGNTLVVTVDVSLREKPRDEYKADVLIYIDEDNLDQLEHESQYRLMIDKLARDVVKSFSLQAGEELGVNNYVRRRRKAA